MTKPGPPVYLENFMPEVPIPEADLPARWTVTLAFDRLVEAADTLRAMPDRERNWLRGAKTAWPEMLTTSAEFYALEIERAVELKEIPVPRPPAPTPGAYDRFLDTVGWLTWFERPDTRLLWGVANGVSPSKLAGRVGVHRNTIMRKKDELLEQLSALLNAHAVPLKLADSSADRLRARVARRGDGRVAEVSTV